MSAVIGSLLELFHGHEIELRTPVQEKHFTNCCAAKIISSIELLKRCLLFMSMNLENKYAHAKRDRHKCGVFFNYICSLLNITDTASLSVQRICSRVAIALYSPFDLNLFLHLLVVPCQQCQNGPGLSAGWVLGLGSLFSCGTRIPQPSKNNLRYIQTLKQ